MILDAPPMGFSSCGTVEVTSSIETLLLYEGSLHINYLNV
jgi:hypothetical protein